MKKVIIVLLPIMFISCEKLDGNRLQKIGSIPVSDAAYIFKRERNTKGASNDEIEGIWKITQEGDEVRLLVLDEMGKDTKIEIYSVVNILENYLLVDTEFGRVLVDKKTNKIYECPKSLYAEERVEEYPSKTIYYTAGWYIYKSQISPQSIEEEYMLPDGQTGSDFFIGQNGTIYYVRGVCYSGGGKIMTKNKRLYPIDYSNIVVFGSADHNIYTIEPSSKHNENIIYKWESLSENEIDKKVICTISNDPEEYSIIHIGKNFAPINTISGNVVLFLENKVYEFNGESCMLKREYSETELVLLKKLFDNIGYLNGYGNQYKTIGPNNVYFDHNPGPIHNDIAVSLDPITYELKSIPFEIPKDQYEVYNTTTDASWGKLLFTALRYSDSSIVLGEVDDTGKVNIISERQSTYPIRECFALN